MRIGQGFDIHAFDDEGDCLMIGGVRIDWLKGLRAHSDGDVLLHAISDALLGAAGLGDIGRHFPDTDEAWRGADSRVLLRQVVNLLAERQLFCSSLDATIVAEAPIMAPWIPQMMARIADDLRIDVGRVNVKATTAEKLGFCGRGEGIAAMANVLLEEP